MTGAAGDPADAIVARIRAIRALTGRPDRRQRDPADPAARDDRGDPRRGRRRARDRLRGDPSRGSSAPTPPARRSSIAARSPAEAEAAVRAGVDVVIAQGSDSGGHTGIVPTFALVPQVVDAAGGVPVLAAGGIADGRGLVAALALGADGALLGTCLVASQESGAHEVYKRRIVEAAADDSVAHRRLRDRLAGAARARPPQRHDRRLGGRARSRASGRATGRWRSSPPGRSPDGEFEIPRWWVDTPHAGDLGAVEEMALYAGPAAGLVREVLPAAEIVRRIAAEAGRGARARMRAGGDDAGTLAPAIAVSLSRMDRLPPGERTLPALAERQAAALRRQAVPARRRDARARSPRCATRSRGLAGELRRGRACATATASRSWRRTGSRSSTPGSRAPGSARSSSRSTRRRAARSSSTSSRTPLPASSSLEARFLEHLDVLERVPPSSSASGCSTRTPGGRLPRPARSRRSRSRARRAAAADVGPGDTVAILYTSGTTGPVEGRDVPAGAVLLVGAQHRGDARRALERRRALHLPAALPHERAQRVHPGAQPRRGVRRRRALLGVALLGPRARRRRDGDLPARRDGLDPLEDGRASPAEKQHRVRVALAPGDADRAARALPRALRRAPARRLRHDRDERRDRRARRRAAPRARWGARCRATRSRSSTRTTRRCPTARPASS